MTPFWAVVGVVGTILGSLILNMVSNECSDLAPWLARRLVRWAAHRQYRGGERATIRAEEWSRIIEDRPGKLFKLATALWFATVALTHPAPHTRANGPLLPRLGRASAQAGIALAVALFVCFTEFWLAARPFTTTDNDVYSSLWCGIACAMAAALETVAPGVPRLPRGLAGGGLIMAVLSLAGLNTSGVAELGLLLGLGPVAVFGVRLAVRLLARRQTGVAVYTALHVVALGAFIALLAYFDGAPADGNWDMTIGSTAIAMVIGLTAGLGVTIGSRTLNALRKSAQPTA